MLILANMSLREFKDSSGALWKVWDITPEILQPVTRAEDYLQGFLEGWLVFERADGREKRRLNPIPLSWQQADDEELERLCRQAQPPQPGDLRRDPLPLPPRGHAS